MEPVSLAVGVMGPAGLISACLDVLERFDSWESSSSDSGAFSAKFRADKPHFEQWVQITGADALSSTYYEALGDPKALESATELLSVIKEIGGTMVPGFPILSTSPDTNNFAASASAIRSPFVLEPRSLKYCIGH